jgi:hypothetical protein
VRLDVVPFEQYGGTPPLPNLDERNYTTQHPLLDCADRFAQSHGNIGL